VGGLPSGGRARGSSPHSSHRYRFCVCFVTFGFGGGDSSVSIIVCCPISFSLGLRHFPHVWAVWTISSSGGGSSRVVPG